MNNVAKITNLQGAMLFAAAAASFIHGIPCPPEDYDATMVTWIHALSQLIVSVGGGVLCSVWMFQFFTAWVKTKLEVSDHEYGRT